MTFRLLCRKYIFNEQKRKNIDLKFLDCPVECPIKGIDLRRNKFCGDCDHKKVADEFRQKVETEWRQKLKTESKKYRFDDLYNLLQSVIGYEDISPDKLSVKSAYFLSVYLSERNKKDKIESWKREQENK